ncbi:MAG: hypothetical protein QNJ53_24465 [Pleurocapsa sp. MO_192.B19]|nr:hypothetical protein [Pleurocapsa sp. MO_192.B19]
MSKIDSLLGAANNRLKSGNVGLVIFKRGNKLSLRGMMPAKPASGKVGLVQQTLSLGLYANAAGIKVAESEALKVSGLIALKEFKWGDYISNKGHKIESAGFWIDKFEEDYFNKRERTAKTQTTWKDYCKVFNKLDKSETLTVESLLAVVLDCPPDSRSRVRACTYTKKLAGFAGIDFDPIEYQGNYSADSVDVRDIPSDEDIQKWRDRMPVKYGLRYAFGLIAAYGLRPYELFYLDLESIKKPPGHLRIVESKRNKKTERFIWCLYPEWYQLWELGNTLQPFPNYSGKTNSDLGNRIGDAFRRYGFYKAYNLRHAWAIRSIAFLPIELAAPMMDHDIAVHRKTYHRFLKQSDYDRFYQMMISQPNRPKPPIS